LKHARAHPPTVTPARDAGSMTQVQQGKSYVRLPESDALMDRRVKPGDDTAAVVARDAG